MNGYIGDHGNHDTNRQVVYAFEPSRSSLEDKQKK